MKTCRLRAHVEHIGIYATDEIINERISKYAKEL